MQYSRTTGYAAAELCHLGSRRRRTDLPGRNRRRPTILHPVQPARPHARRAAINESLAA